MVAETLSSTRAAASFPDFNPAGAGTVACAHGTYELAANVETGDIFELCRLPPDATVIAGWVYADDLDTNIAETLDMDVGWASNGIDAADPDGFGNLGVWTGDAVTDHKPEVWNRFPFGGVMKDGPKTFGAAATTIQVQANAAAATGGTGTLSVVVLYLTP